jgi:toxin-antitoxin system PIN domain toxin
VFVVDTNVLVYAANAGSPFHPACRKSLEAWRRGPGPWYATWAILYEFLRVTTHPRVLSPAWTARQAWGFVDSLLASPGFGVLVATPRHAAVAAQAMREIPQLSGNLLHDAHTAILMREHGIRRVHTRDTDFHRFPWVEVVDPVR